MLAGTWPTSTSTCKQQQQQQQKSEALLQATCLHLKFAVLQHACRSCAGLCMRPASILCLKNLDHACMQRFCKQRIASGGTMPACVLGTACGMYCRAALLLGTCPETPSYLLASPRVPVQLSLPACCCPHLLAHVLCWLLGCLLPCSFNKTLLKTFPYPLSITNIQASSVSISSSLRCVSCNIKEPPGPVHTDHTLIYRMPSLAAAVARVARVSRSSACVTPLASLDVSHGTKAGGTCCISHVSHAASDRSQAL